MSSIKNVSRLFEKFYAVKNFLNTAGDSVSETELKQLLEDFLNELQQEENRQDSYAANLVYIMINLLRPYFNIPYVLEFADRILTGSPAANEYRNPGSKTIQRPNMSFHIGVVYHKNFELFFRDCLYPIHAGKAVSNFELGLPGDDWGDNISFKNPAYAELTALYWIWKNVKADVKGLMHYRRFLFLKDGVRARINEIRQYDIKEGFNAACFLNNMGYNQENLTQMMEKYDIITRNPDDFEIWSDFSMATHYAYHHIEKHLAMAFDVLKKDYPNMLPYFIETLSGSTSYFSNVFIMKNEEFDKYCSWLFDILFKIEKKINPYDINLASETVNTRWAGYLGERLTGAYLRMRKLQGAKFWEAPLIMLDDNANYWRNADTYDKSTLIDQNDRQRLNDMNNLSAPLVSVILDLRQIWPAEHSVKFILKQSIKNIEIITIGKSLCEYLPENTHSIEVESLYEAVSAASGKYLHIMNPRDFIEKNFYENAVLDAEKNSSEIVLMSYRNVNYYNYSLAETSLLPPVLYGSNLNVEKNPDILMDNPTFFNKLFLREFLLENKDCLTEQYMPAVYWKIILKAKKISILRDSQYKHIMQKHPIFYEDCIKRIFGMFDDLDKFIKNQKNKNTRDFYNIYKARSLYNLICLNLASIAKDDGIAKIILNYLAKNNISVSKEAQKCLDFYIYDKKMMDEINKNSSVGKIRKLILDNTADLVMAAIKVVSDSYYLSEL